MNRAFRASIYVLSALAIVLVASAVWIWLRPSDSTGAGGDIRFGLYEGRELVCRVDSRGNTAYMVADAEGHKLFNVPVRGCTLDVRYRNGRLRFREAATGREGFIDKDGIVTFTDVTAPRTGVDAVKGNLTLNNEGHVSSGNASDEKKETVGQKASAARQLTDGELKRMLSDNPFSSEAKKILAGKLDETDRNRRRVILNYCEHLRAAYVTKDIDFIKQVFSEHALIIVGNVVRESKGTDGKFLSKDRVTYNIRTKREYVERLTRAFASNRKIDVRFSDFRILRHPTMEGIYGVTLRQRYKSDRYSDDGWLFLLWDFRDPSMPRIHVRTWQPQQSIKDGDEIIGIGDFNLE